MADGRDGEGDRWERWGGWQMGEMGKGGWQMGEMGREEVKEVNMPSLHNMNLTSSPVITS